LSQRFVLIGHPVAHSLSPAIHQAAYRERLLPHRYELCDAPDEAKVREVVQGIRDGSIGGANVTVPWKKSALALADRADATAADVGAANTLVRAEDGAVVAYNTDVRALAAELGGLVTAPERALVLGAGGAALATLAAARLAGAREIAVTARRFSAAVPRSTWPGADALSALGAELLAWPPLVSTDDNEVARFAARAGLVIQATSAGMHGADSGDDVARIVPWRRLPPGAGAYDLVYNPAVTSFLKAAESAGVSARGGLGMLVGQAALAFEIWFGLPAPRAVMQAAAEAALLARSR
jgi:shikimate dehydrogenase